jgi:IS4 transposase
LAGYHVKVLDGNHLSATEHRLEALRQTWAAPLPGKALVVLDQQGMLIRDVFLTEDGHAQERSLLDDVLETVDRGDLWLADRNFCTQSFLCGLASRGGYFVVRQHGQLQGRLLGQRKSAGTTETGRVYEQKLLIQDPRTGADVSVRRITLELFEETRDGETEIHLLSNLPQRVRARHLADLYRKRWTIEAAFLEITTTLTCEIKTLAYPKAALFAFCLALLAYNAVSIIKAALRREHGRERIDQGVSGYYLALEIRQTYDGMMVALPPPQWTIFAQMSVPQFARFLRDTAAHATLSKYKKHSRGPKKPPPKKIKYKNGGHVSTAKLIANRT